MYPKPTRPIAHRGASGAIVTLAAATAVLVLALVSAPADADTTAPLYSKMKQRFTATTPGVRTAWSFDGALKPWPAGEQVPPQRGATFVFPRGTRFDLAAAPSCRATDEQITAEGTGVCPRRSQVGEGEASIFVGAAGAIDVQARVFVARPELALVFLTENGAVLRVLRGTVSRNRIVAEVPSMQVGDYEVAVTRLAFAVRAAGTRKHALIRTPRECPRSGRWKFVYLPRYDEPYGVQRSTSKTRCRPE